MNWTDQGLHFTFRLHLWLLILSGNISFQLSGQRRNWCKRGTSCYWAKYLDSLSVFQLPTFHWDTVWSVFCMGCTPDKILCLPQWPFEIGFRRPSSPLFCQFYLDRRKQSGRRGDKQLCTLRSCSLSWGQSLSLLFFWYFMKAAVSQANVSKCQVMICITGYDPKKIWHATLVSRQKKGIWSGVEEVGMDEEKRGKGEGLKSSSSHDRQSRWWLSVSPPPPMHTVMNGTFNIALLKGITGMYLSSSNH